MNQNRFPDDEFLQLVDKVSRSVPNDVRYRKADELAESRARLADTHETVTLEAVGQSAEGEPIELMRIGSGPIPLLFIGTPHPGEVLGTLTIEHIAQQLLEDGDLASEFDNCTCLFLQVCDPDGYRLNEPWFDREHTPTNHVLYHYRPAFPEQPIWSFPVKYKDYTYHNPCPECQALMEVIERYLPVYVNEFHNGEVMNCFGFSSFESSNPRLKEYLSNLAESIGTGFRDLFQPATTANRYDRLVAEGEETPESEIFLGAGTWEYLNRKRLGSDWFCFELPYWRFERIAKEGDFDSEYELREVRQESLDTRERATRCMLPHYETVSNLPGAGTNPSVQRLLRAVDERLRMFPLEKYPSYRKALDDLEERKATHSETYLALGLSVYYNTRTVGILWRAADMMGVDEAAAELREVVARHLEYLTQEYSVIPIHELVRIQTASALVSMKMSVDYLLNFVTD